MICNTLSLRSALAWSWKRLRRTNPFTVFWTAFWIKWPSSHKKRSCFSRGRLSATARRIRRATGWLELCRSMSTWRRATRWLCWWRTSPTSCCCGWHWPNWDALLLYWTTTSDPNLCCTASPAATQKSWLPVQVSSLFVCESCTTFL